jgi:hypothetical protein
VISKRVERMTPRPGVDNGSEMRAFAEVAYEFKAGGKTHRGTRVSIGEDLGNVDVAETLVRYPAGAEVTVYVNPEDPAESVLERDPPKGAFGCLGLGIALMVSGAIVAADGLTWLGATLRAVLPNPQNAPFVIGFSFFALCCGLMAFAASRQPLSKPGEARSVLILWISAIAFAIAAVLVARRTGS